MAKVVVGGLQRGVQLRVTCSERHVLGHLAEEFAFGADEGIHVAPRRNQHAEHLVLRTHRRQNKRPAAGACQTVGERAVDPGDVSLVDEDASHHPRHSVPVDGQACLPRKPGIRGRGLRPACRDTQRVGDAVVQQCARKVDREFFLHSIHHDLEDRVQVTPFSDCPRDLVQQRQVLHLFQHPACGQPLLAFSLFACGDVVRRYEDALVRRMNDEVEPCRCAVGVGEFVLQTGRPPLTHRLAELREQRSVLDTRIALRHRAPDQLGPFAASLSRRAVVHVDVTPVEADDLATLLHVVHRLPEPRFALAQSLGHALVLLVARANPVDHGPERRRERADLRSVCFGERNRVVPGADALRSNAQLAQWA